MRRFDNEGVTPIIGFVIAVVLFTVSFYYVVQTAVERQGDTSSAQNSNFETEAQSLANVVLQPGKGWYSAGPCLGTLPNTAAWTPDGVGAVSGGQPLGRFGVGDEGCAFGAADPRAHNNLSFDKFENLQRSMMVRDNTNGHVDYAEARDSLGLAGSNVDFHLRSWPVLPSVREMLGTGVKDPNMRVLYIGDYTVTHGGGGGTGIPPHTVTKDTSVGDRVKVKFWIQNDGTGSVAFNVVFTVDTNSPIGLTLHTKVLAPGESQEISFTLLKTQDWAWKTQGSTTKSQVDWELYGKTTKLDSGSLDMSGIDMTAYSGNRQQQFLEANSAYFAQNPLPATTTVTYSTYKGNGDATASKVKWSDWRIHVLKPDGTDLLAPQLLTDNVQSATYSTSVSTAGSYDARLESDDGATLWNNDTINVAVTPPGSYLPSGGSTNVVVGPSVAPETRLIDLLVEQFDRNVYSPDYVDAANTITYAPGGDIYPDVKAVMDNDLPTVLTDAAGHPTLSKYTTMIVGSRVDQNAMTSAAAKQTIADWVAAGGTLIVFGSDAQSVQWLQPIFHASLDSASGALFTPDEENPVLNVPNQLDYTTYNPDSVWQYNAGFGGYFEHVVEQGGDLLALNNPGAFGQGSVILSGWEPWDLTSDEATTCPDPIQPDSPCQALFLINNLITMTYRSLYLDYGPPVPAAAASGVQTRIASVYHPQLHQLVTVQLQVFAFAGSGGGPGGAGGAGVGCSSDTTPPSTLGWSQSPSDVQTTTTGTVTVYLTLTDDCIGVNDGVNPTLYYRLNDGSNPSFVSAGPMTLIGSPGSHQWSGTIPDSAWSAASGKTLEYEAKGFQDLQGNSPTSVSTIGSDLIQVTCGSDTSPPTVQTWSHSPSDVKSSTATDVTVTAQLADDCAGVDDAGSHVPTLWYRLDDGTGTASFTQVPSAMTSIGTHQWQGVIPNPTWGSQAGKTLQFELQNLWDLRGNQGVTPIQSDAIELDCSADSAAPTVQAWTQSPADVKTSTTGPITVTATLTDACAGVDTSASPTLYYRINGGSWTSAGSMVWTSGTTWQGTIPDLIWSGRGGQLLEYYVQDQKDLASPANQQTGITDIRSDLIDSTTTISYVASNTVTTGTMTNFNNAKSASDGGASAALTEGAVSSSVTMTLNANGYVSAQTDTSCWATPGSGAGSDNAYATCATQDKDLQLSLADQSYTAGPVTSIVLKAELSIAGYKDDGFRLQACFGATCSAQSATISAAYGSDVTVSYDVTSQRPGGGSWTAADLNNLEIRVESKKNGAADGTWRVDHAYATVACSCQTYQLADQMGFSGVAAGSTYLLEVRYSTSVESYDLQVWQPATSSWTTRGTALSSASATTWSYSLTSSEYNAGAPAIRFVDRTPSGTTQGSLSIDYARITTS